MAENDVSTKVLEQIRVHGPLKAKKIADALGIDRAEVNRILHGQLRGKVKQDNNYNWSLVERIGPDPTKTPGNSRENLFAYYLDCVAQDDDSGVRTFADSKYDLDYVELEEWPLEADHPNFQTEPLRKLIGRQRREARKKALWLGYPVRLRQVRSPKGWEGAFLEPLIIWRQDPEATEIDFLPEALINTRALESLISYENVLEEAAKLAEELGLDAEPPPLDELVARLRYLRPEWDWKEDLTPGRFRGFGTLRRIAESGIFNSAVVILADRSPFTIGLERELTDLRRVEDKAIDGTSLSYFLGKQIQPAAIDASLLEPITLNTEQRTAVRQALGLPLTVITGPPGTGKSQVVAAILVNAACRGLRVLFASKNNKAVDVVTQRVNALGSRPIILRLGTRALNEQLAQHIAALLSDTPTEEDLRAYDSVLVKLNEAVQLLKQVTVRTDHLIEVRNKVDGLERAAEAARKILSATAFANSEGFSITNSEACLIEAEEALYRSRFETASLVERLIWCFLKKARLRRLDTTIAKLCATLHPLGIQPVGAAEPNSILAHGRELLDASKAAVVYHAALKELSNTPDTGALAAELANQTRVLAEISSDVWDKWIALIPNRLSSEDRSALGDYAAVLRTISKADDEGGTVAKQIWRSYFELAAKTTKALPCWAVTSLSVRGRIPFTPGEFDLVVIDEASQCDIASALPLLFRAKRAVIIGDPQQLRHISRLSEQQDQTLMVKRGILDRPGPSWAYRANSLFDLAAAKAAPGSIVSLRDHHRSHSDIIDFSNRFFYRGKLRVATDYRRLKRPDGPAIRWITVTGKVERPSTGSAINRDEAAAVVNELRRIAITQRFSGEIGVVTPFRAQANLIEELIARDDGLAPVLASRNFISETAHKFQGDERDLILFSPVVSQGTPAGAIGFLKGQGNIFNVGITRARAALVVVGDAAVCALSEVHYLSAFAKYVAERSRIKTRTQLPQSPEPVSRSYPAVAQPELVSEWEKVFYTALVDAGLRAIPQLDVDQYILDFALIRPNGRRLNIEVDGERYHRDWDGELVRRDQIRNLRLIEMGWDVIRFWVYEIRDSLSSCIDRVSRWVAAADAMPGIVNDAGPAAPEILPK